MQKSDESNDQGRRRRRLRRRQLDGVVARQDDELPHPEVSGREHLSRTVTLRTHRPASAAKPARRYRQKDSEAYPNGKVARSTLVATASPYIWSSSDALSPAWHPTIAICTRSRGCDTANSVPYGEVREIDNSRCHSEAGHGQRQGDFPATIHLGFLFEP